jgi:hypothetical protein
LGERLEPSFGYCGDKFMRAEAPLLYYYPDLPRLLGISSAIVLCKDACNYCLTHVQRRPL